MTRVCFHDFQPETRDLLAEVQEGLQKEPKTIAPKFFYDERGSKLFSKITTLREYYLTTTELKILKTRGKEIGDTIGGETLIIEYGCGSSEKIKELLDHFPGIQTYVAIDISKEPLLEMTHDLADTFPSLEVIALCADFTNLLELPLNGGHTHLKRIAFFPGSSIGNFDPVEAKSILQNILDHVGCGGGLLIGVDLKKDPEILHAAYNDSRGVTEAFNKNLLQRINRECQGDFDFDLFRHRAFYNAALGRVEMHLESLLDQVVHLNGDPLNFRAGETIHTENSYKYHVEEFQELALSAGWHPIRTWKDDRDFFSIHYLEAR